MTGDGYRRDRLHRIDGRLRVNAQRPFAVVLSVALAAIAAACCAGATAAEALRVIYPQSESRLDGRAIYPIAILELALQHSGSEFHMQPSVAKMQQSRSLRMLAEGRDLDVVWTVATPEREAMLRPIRIPIDLGLIGWRALLVHSGDAQRFAAVESLGDLARFTGVQGHDWPDLRIMRANGLRVAATATYEGLFAMLVREHVDYLPRGVSEIDRELERRTTMPIEIEQTLLLHYPSALYFFVHPDNDALAQALETGLERCIADGSLRQTLQERFGERLRNLHLADRKLLDLRNADLPESTPLRRPELWFDPMSMSP